MFGFQIQYAYFCNNYYYTMNAKEIGAVIKSRRQELQIKQQDLADLAGVNINTIVATERGMGNPKIETLIAICDVLGLQTVVKLKD